MVGASRLVEVSFSIDSVCVLKFKKNVSISFLTALESGYNGISQDRNKMFLRKFINRRADIFVYNDINMVIYELSNLRSNQ